MNASYQERLLRAQTEAKGWAGIHNPVGCMGEWCVFHDPSDHHMRSWMKDLRSSGLVERLCEHNVGHPDPDSAAYFVRLNGDRSIYDHGCDGCCVPPNQEEVIVVSGIGEVTITIIRG